MLVCLKRKAFNQCILPALIFGSETWSLTVKNDPETTDISKEYGKMYIGDNKLKAAKVEMGISICMYIKQHMDKYMLEWKLRDARRAQKKTH